MSFRAGSPSGETVTAEIESELLIREVTAPLTFEVEARDEGSEISITGRTTFTWDDLQMQKPSARSVVSLADEVRVEVVLSASPQTEAYRGNVAGATSSVCH